MHKHATVAKHPMDYPVPNFGADPDMETNMRSLEIAEEKTGKKLIMGTPESKAQWKNPADDTKLNVVSAIMSNDSKILVVIASDTDKHF